MRVRALAERDIGAVYRVLHRDGVSQREIARRTGQSQAEVSEIMQGGRQVRDITVLERIADGLGVPRPFLRILTHAPGDGGGYSGRRAPAKLDVAEISSSSAALEPGLLELTDQYVSAEDALTPHRGLRS